MQMLTQVNVYQGQQNETDFPEEDAVKALFWFQEKILGIPAEFRDSAILEFDCGVEDTDDGCISPIIKIYYYRPETLELAALREAELQRQLNITEQEERAMLEKLKRKYEDW